ncbi:MAG: site-specific integrase [Bacteroidetes bacterium]|nr:site-specific integrase [Bacteroidota bacterium]MCL6102772.1 site-specific integrase [Bacteroidota bacterium]
MIFKAIILKGKELQNGDTNIKIHFSFKGVRKDIPTRFYINPSCFSKGNVKSKHPNADYINIEIKKKILEYDIKMAGVNYQDWTANQIVTFLKSESKFTDVFFPFFEGFIVLKWNMNKRTGEIYQATLNKIKSFEKNDKLHFSEVTVMWLRRFENSMQQEGLKPNTISIHLRNIRAVFNAAIDDNVIPLASYPYRRFKIKSEVTRKKAVTIEQLKKIRDYQTDYRGMRMVRDTFMLSFYLIGINNSDLYKLKAIEKNGRLEYSRSKTKRTYSIKVQPEALMLIKAYKGKNKLLCHPDIYDKPETMTSVLNSKLKVIGDAIGVQGLTMYHARHTWATIAANQLNASDEDIGQALGHSEKTVTAGYINRDPDRVDILNRKVLDLLN